VHGGFDSSLHDALLLLVGWLSWRVHASMPNDLPAMQCCAAAGADRIERLLSLGASRGEATRDLLGRAVRLAMTPLLNQMSVVGLVSIPGMMTGQILGGSHPDQAARCVRIDVLQVLNLLHCDVRINRRFL
jgi:hypothetical protein